jgi:hypothetical protein
MDGLKKGYATLVSVLAVTTLLPSVLVANQEAPTTPAGAGKADQATQQRVQQLESLLQAQSARIESLKGQLHRAEQGTTPAARVEEIRSVVREMMADSAFRDSLYPDVTQVGYDKGFYIRSSDEDYLLRINGLMKVRYTGQQRQSDNPRRQGIQKQDDINGFEIEDMWMYFTGYINTPKLSYNIIVTGDTDQANDWRTYTAYINYQFVEEFEVVAGLLKIPFGRQWLVDQGQLQFIDRSLAAEAFNPGRTVGVGLHGRLANRVTYNIGMANGMADADDSLNHGDMDTNFAYIARVVASLLGPPIREESDLVYSKDPRMEVGLSFAYLDDNGDRATRGFYTIPEQIRRGRGIGDSAYVSAIGADATQIGADWAFRYRGFSATTEYFLRSINGDNKYSAWELRTLDDGWSSQQGGYAQLGYFIVPKRIETIARLGGMWDLGDANTWEYTFGVNYYPWGSYNFFLQADFTHIDEAPTTSTNGNWSQNDEVNMFRVQVQARF